MARGVSMVGMGGVAVGGSRNGSGKGSSYGRGISCGREGEIRGEDIISAKELVPTRGICIFEISKAGVPAPDFSYRHPPSSRTYSIC